MGSGLCGSKHVLPPEITKTAELQRLVDRWKVSDEELAFFYAKFKALDIDNGGTVEFDEFFSFLKEPRSRFQDTMFSLLVQGQDQLTFPRWLLTVFSFCFATHEEVVEQIFMWYDSQKQGIITLEDLHNFLVSVHGDNSIFPSEVTTQLTLLCAASQGKFDFDEFGRALQKFPMLLWPIFRLQEKMRAMVIGEDLFKRIDARSGDVQLGTHHHSQSPWQKRLAAVERWFCCCCKKAPKVTAEEKQYQLRRQVREEELKLQRAQEEEDGIAPEHKIDIAKILGEEDEIERQKREEKMHEEGEESSDSDANRVTDVEEDDLGD